MSDAKKCDRCGRYYMMRGEHNDIRPTLEDIRIFGIRYTSGANVGISDCDLCPKCAEKVYKYISGYDEPAEDQGLTLNKENMIMSEDEYDRMKCVIIEECSANISRLKENYGTCMSSRNVTINYWPNFDIYLMSALHGSDNLAHWMVKGDVDYETLVSELLRFFGHLDGRW